MKKKQFLELVSLLILFPSLGLAQGGWITLPAQAFIAMHSDYTFNHSISFNGESYLYPRGSTGTIFLAPVVFPPEANGLSVRQMNVTVGDFDNDTRVTAILLRMNRYSGVTQAVFYVETGVAAEPGKTVISDSTGGYRLIDNHKYAWFVYSTFSGVPMPQFNIRLYAVRIQYK